MQTCKWTHMAKSEIFLPLRRLEVWFLCNVGTQEWYTEERVKSGSLARLPLGLWGVTKRGSTAFVEGNSQAPLGHSQPALWTPEGCLIINTCKQNSPKRCFFYQHSCILTKGLKHLFLHLWIWRGLYIHLLAEPNNTILAQRPLPLGSLFRSSIPILGSLERRLHTAHRVGAGHRLQTWGLPLHLP